MSHIIPEFQINVMVHNVYPTYTCTCAFIQNEAVVDVDDEAVDYRGIPGWEKVD